MSMDIEQPSSNESTTYYRGLPFNRLMADALAIVAEESVRQRREMGPSIGSPAMSQVEVEHPLIEE